MRSSLQGRYEGGKGRIRAERLAQSAGLGDVLS